MLVSGLLQGTVHSSNVIGQDFSVTSAGVILQGQSVAWREASLLVGGLSSVYVMQIPGLLHIGSKHETCLCSYLLRRC